MEQKASQVSSKDGSHKKKEEENKVVDEEWLVPVEINVAEKRDNGVVRIVLISDTHNRHRMLKMPEGDVLIHAGDFTNKGTEQEIREFDAWLASLDYQHKIVVPGNHDKGMDSKTKQGGVQVTEVTNANVLRGEMVEVMGLRVFGLPHTLNLPLGREMSAFGCGTEEEMKERAGGIPSANVDILVSHSPPWGIGDTNRTGKHCGSQGLREVVFNADQLPKLWAFGHVHESGGNTYRAKGTKTILMNAASFLRSEEGLRPPVVIDICKETKAPLGVTAVANKDVLGSET